MVFEFVSYFREILYDKDPAEGKMLIKTNNTMKGFL